MISLANRLILASRKPRGLTLVTSGGYLPGDFVLSASSSYTIPSGFTLLARDIISRTVSAGGGETDEISAQYCISYKIFTTTEASLPTSAVRSVHLRDEAGGLAQASKSSGSFVSTDYDSPVAVVSWDAGLSQTDPVTLPSLTVSGATKIKDYYNQYSDSGGNGPQYIYGAVRAQAFCSADGDLRPGTYTLPSASWRVVYGA